MSAWYHGGASLVSRVRVECTRDLSNVGACQIRLSITITDQCAVNKAVAADYGVFPLPFIPVRVYTCVGPFGRFRIAYYSPEKAGLYSARAFL